MTHSESVAENQLNMFPQKDRPIWDEPIFQDIQPHIVRSFWQFHLENPEIFGLFRSFCQDVRNSGRRAYGAGAVFERIRWHVNIDIKGADEFKINNNLRSCYARFLILNEPSYADFFSTRGTKGVA